MSKIIITIVGRDRVGIVAKTCNYLAENNINILDITQTILQEYFNMMMIVDISRAEKSFDDMAKELAEVGREIGVTIHCQREEIFTSMHRI
ncbi:MAG: ACT domain-containing protein [Clostridium sp.]|nr:ACT domain-containing protein [Clostridium sp.]